MPRLNAFAGSSSSLATCSSGEHRHPSVPVSQHTENLGVVDCLFPPDASDTAKLSVRGEPEHDSASLLRCHRLSGAAAFAYGRVKFCNNEFRR